MPTQTIQFETGETTCASKPGVFCPFFTTRGLGNHLFCGLFDVSLLDKEGWVQRHITCRTRLGSGPFKFPNLETLPDSEVDAA